MDIVPNKLFAEGTWDEKVISVLLLDVAIFIFTVNSPALAAAYLLSTSTTEIPEDQLFKLRIENMIG
ncbi:hypothetical protein [uncultured Nostoc sp.]|uniref:hypothetical protein n=1 Tax=uncultured Nostoc sp. TaxID=340711 RepID=UPI0035C9F2E2